MRRSSTSPPSTTGSPAFETGPSIKSGTSMAAPHVTGAAALVKTLNAGFTPPQVRDYLVNNATQNVVTNPGTYSPNRLLFIGTPSLETPGFGPGEESEPAA
ncbi:S8 family serine peptidase [Streptosporangium sandarakinum]|uniref:S8 family serine peptidase n=1 Tax=Streptosporangium sandarakinum TaxID=1260955 RepID=UPI00343E64A4